VRRDYRHDVSGLQASSQRHEAAGPNRTFLVRFIEGGVVECIEASLDRPGQGRVMDVGLAQRHRFVWGDVAFLDTTAGST
jgi:hypothetical protein